MSTETKNFNGKGGEILLNEWKRTVPVILENQNKRTNINRKRL